MKRNTYFLLILFSLMVILSACSLNKEETTVEERPIPVSTQKVELKEITKTERFVGKSESINDVQVFPKVGGKVEKVYVKQGDKVTKGQLLIELDDSDLQYSLRQAQAGYQAALANLNQAKETSNSSIIRAENQLELAEDAYQKAKDNLDSSKKLYEKEQITKIQLDQAETAFLQAESNLEISMDALAKAKSESGITALESQVEQTKIAVQQAQNAITQTKILAPIDGKVSLITVEAGEMAAPQSPVAQIIGEDIILVKLNVSEGQINNFHAGDKVLVKFSAIDEQVEGTVSTVAAAANKQNLTFPVDIEVQSNNYQLKSGMLAEVILENTEDEKQLTIPTQSVMGTENDRYVFIVKDQKAEKRKITVKEMMTNITIVSSGLAEHEDVVTKGQYQLIDGTLVEIIGEEGKE